MFKMGERRRIEAVAARSEEAVRRMATSLNAATRSEVRALQAIVAQLNERVGRQDAAIAQLTARVEVLERRP